MAKALRKLLDEHNAEQATSGWPSRVEMAINIDKTLLDQDEPNDEYIYWPN